MATELDRIKARIADNPPRAAWLPVLIKMLERDARRLRNRAADAELRIMPDAPELITGFPHDAACERSGSKPKSSFTGDALQPDGLDKPHACGRDELI